MSAAENDPPLTVELLADLQAGLLDDDTAANLRDRIRADPEAQRVLLSLQQVRHDVAAVGADADSAPEVPAAVTDKVSAALRSAPAPSSAAHAARPPLRPARIAAGIAGLGALAAAIGVGTTALLHEPPPAPSAPTTAQHITVSTPPATIPLSPAQIRDLLNRRPDYGPLNTAGMRASCLAGLGYPTSVQVLGAQQIDINARPGVLLVVPGDTPDSLAALAVALNCSAADTGLLASTVVPRA
ncbi:anti-sigma-M factor RsmA [Mycobacterium kubicae]|uniref:Anti-sigma-M factor RsmA n=1 Tax=Mycobacterium kubicae TaxID=120959 RepID=A0AAX1J967_9MYCO|nr:hypothetical protein [Mycobacterium kubicae]MCV7094901.1 hypothetical protein [Mycobacterium kubicae]ORW02799.1 hypothetical protein AWC13_03660 [Mycobacterium kubicae]QNI14489.1 hypothetical protein GAN18_28475 [Mycobacterium kubicae]QPI38014.1 hypothetical protein I2456_27920 [Mycobacterium kubicae]GFG65650.1 anti-sigma-M factor RsmA [Mycobacterium kubicae]